MEVLTLQEKGSKQHAAKHGDHHSKFSNPCHVFLFTIDCQGKHNTKTKNNRHCLCIGAGENNAAIKDVYKRQARDAANAVMCAGLLHDIGNPPFGHFGEVVIGDWFKSHLDRLS